MSYSCEAQVDLKSLVVHWPIVPGRTRHPEKGPGGPSAARNHGHERLALHITPHYVTANWRERGFVDYRRGSRYALNIQMQALAEPLVTCSLCEFPGGASVGMPWSQSVLKVFGRGRVAIVMDRDKFLGLITRTDLLSYLRLNMPKSAAPREREYS